MNTELKTWLATCSKEEFLFCSFCFFSFDSWNWTGSRLTCTTGQQVLTNTGRNHLSRRLGKAIPDFQSVEITFFFLIFLPCSSDSEPASYMALHCHHCDEGTFNRKRRPSLGLKELRKGALVGLRVWGNLFIFLFYYSPFFILKATPILWNCTKHRRPHLSSQGNRKKMGHCEPNIGEMPEREDWRWGSLNSLHKPTLGLGSPPSWAHVG